MLSLRQIQILTMKKVLFIAAAAFLYACGGGADHDHAGHDHEGHDHAEAEATVAAAMYGASFDTTGAAPINMLAANLEEGKNEGVYKARIVESCQKMGCWMSVENPSGEPMMVYMGDHEFFVPKTGVDGLDCYISGNAYYDTLTVDFQKHLLEDANAAQEEIDAVTEEKYEMAFTATGVVIEGYVPSEGEEEMEGEHNHDHDHEHEHEHEHGEGEHAETEEAATAS